MIYFASKFTLNLYVDISIQMRHGDHGQFGRVGVKIYQWNRCVWWLFAYADFVDGELRILMNNVAENISLCHYTDNKIKLIMWVYDELKRREKFCICG